MQLRQVEAVSDRDHPAGCGEDQPLDFGAPREGSGGADHQGEKKHITNGVGQVDGHSHWLMSQRSGNGVKEKGGADSRGTQSRSDAIEPRGRDEPSRLPAEDQNQSDVGGWVKEQIEEVGQLGTVRLGGGGKDRIAGSPGEYRQAQDHGDGSTSRSSQAEADAQERRDELESDWRPVVDDGLGRLGHQELG
jgi:hypothetical protein